MKKLLPLFILLLAFSTFAQSDLPEIGSIADLKGKTKFYLSADAFNTKWMLKEFNKQKILTRVDKPEGADFFVEYRTLTRDTVTSLQLIVETGQLDVYFYRDKKKVIAWSESDSSSMKLPSAKMTGKFLKAIGAKK